MMNPVNLTIAGDPGRHAPISTQSNVPSIRASRSALPGLMLPVALIAVALWLLLPAPVPAAQNYGSLRTPFGTAAVLCGGEATVDCAAQTALRFVGHCDTEMSRYFSGANEDQRIRRLTGRQAPRGTTWTLQCGASQDLVDEHGPAHLERAP